jgi:hypothetical protein
MDNERKVKQLRNELHSTKQDLVIERKSNHELKAQVEKLERKLDN